MTPPSVFTLSTAADDGVPEGFRRLDETGPYFQQLGPVYARETETGGVVLGLRVARNHLNVQGITHGGMLTTLADGALGINVWLARRQRSAQVTVSLTVDFLSSARVGEWLEAHVTIHRLGRTLAYASCDLKVGARQVLRSSGVFALLDRPLPEGALPPQDG